MDWRKSILQPFTPDTDRKIVVLDPDGILREERLFRQLAERGFSVVHFEDPIAFRITYEEEFRSEWDQGRSKDLVVAAGPEPVEFEEIPADVLENARRMSFHLQDIFPNLSYNVVSQLDKVYFDQLFPAHQQYATEPLGDNSTKDFILRHVFEIAPELIKRESDLLRALLQRHYRNQNVPQLLDRHLISILQASQRFSEWPLEQIVPDRVAFWEFLQKRWQIFLTKQAGKTEEEMQVAYGSGALGLSPANSLPFEHHDVRVYMDTLFAEGILKPVEWVSEAVKKLPWTKVGMRGAAENMRAVRYDKLFETINGILPEGEASVQDWLSFAPTYASLRALQAEDTHGMDKTEKNRFDEISTRIRDNFYEWVKKSYAGLFNSPASSPVMVHHIPAYLSQSMKGSNNRRIAFLLIDGLALDQWQILKTQIEPKIPKISLYEDSLLAWIPTTTAVSRQAAFAGKIPGYFTDTINRTDKDESGWRRFWADQGFAPNQVSFAAVNGNPEDLGKIDEKISHNARILGLTLFKVDKIMHGNELGLRGMAAQVRTWGAGSFLSDLLNKLVKEQGFEVWLSADHGNTEAKGIGEPREGVLSETGGQRCRVYTDTRLREQTANKFVGSICWDHQALPNNYYCLLAPSGSAFAQKEKTIVCHGGISLEEVVVPFVRITRKEERY